IKMSDKKRTIEPVFFSRTGVFQPTNRTPTNSETWSTETPYGTALVKGKLCQIHKKILNLIMYCSYGSFETKSFSETSGKLNLIFDIKKVSKEYGSTNIEFIETKIHEIMESRITIIDKINKKEKINTSPSAQIISDFEPCDGLKGRLYLPIDDSKRNQASYGSDQRYYSVISISKVFSDMLFADLALIADSTGVRKLNNLKNGTVRAIASYMTTHRQESTHSSQELDKILSIIFSTEQLADLKNSGNLVRKRKIVSNLLTTEKEALRVLGLNFNSKTNVISVIENKHFSQVFNKNYSKQIEEKLI
ncbi:hypothetical protein JXK06_00800, partial [Patescibacteria group bacterium]|nr:hypothetical protein [Patescibacteria group bacterium]